MKNTILEKLEATKVLRGWKGLDVIPNVEEKPEDIWLLIKYDDHGDDFLVVGTRDGHLYNYALYVNRKYTDFYTYLRKPELFKQLDNYANVSNEIFFKFERLFRKSHMLFGYDLKCSVKSDAQRRFNEAIEYMTELAKTADSVFDWENKKPEIERWLQLNEIDTEDNLKKLKDTPFHNKIGENRVIGIAGKRDITGLEWISGDHFDFICVNNKELDPEKVIVEGEYDEWGVASYRLPIKGFIPSKK